MVKEDNYTNINIPKHVAIIMDGNGRWAKKRGLPKNQGHQKGASRVIEITKCANQLGIKYLTIFAFSTENWNRPKDEVDYLMSLPIKYFKENLKKYKDENIKITFIGTTERVNDELKEVIKKVTLDTKDSTGINLIIAFNYGSRNEITSAIKNIIKDKIKEENINENLVSNYLFTKNVPDVDLMIRTSGEKRLSNFLLWQNSYSEFVFTNTLWPDFRPKEFIKIIQEYSNRDRRFGGRK